MKVSIRQRASCKRHLNLVRQKVVLYGYCAALGGDSWMERDIGAIGCGLLWSFSLGPAEGKRDHHASEEIFATPLFLIAGKLACWPIVGQFEFLFRGTDFRLTHYPLAKRERIFVRHT